MNAGGAWANSNGASVGVGPAADTPTWVNDVFAFPGAHAQYVGAFSNAASGSVNGGNNGGFIGGGQAGYNWQFYNSFVVGLEADIQGIAASNASRTFANGAVVPSGLALGDGFIGINSLRGSLDYLGTVRGRLGWLFTPTLLIFGTGGLAYGGVTLNTATFVAATGGFIAPFLSPASGGVNFSNTQVGWTAGGGVEWMFWPNWSAKVEYLYYDLGTVSQNFALASASFAGGTEVFGGQVRVRTNGNIVRAGVNYHFNWAQPAPVLAKY